MRRKRIPGARWWMAQAGLTRDTQPGSAAPQAKTSEEPKTAEQGTENKKDTENTHKPK
jgi:hypothetical protein